METLPDQFKKALARIEVNGEKRERAISAHTEIREVPEADETLREWGIDSILIGSYARHTGIHPGKDVDVFMRLTELTTDADPGEVFDHVAKVLTDEYGERASRQRRSIKVDFEVDGFAVDAVPAVRSGSRWAIPSRDTDTWGDPDADRWVETDPLKLGSLTTAMNKDPKVDGQGAYVPTVKLVRQTRKHHLGDAKPGGLYFELLAYRSFEAGVPGESFAEIFAAALRLIADQLASADELTDSALDKPYEPAPEQEELDHAAEVFGELADDAAAALTMERCPAAVIWRRILGDNDRGACFPLPDGCDDEGRSISRVTSTGAVGSREAGGFAGS
ncbi:nucleotidyltransferase domain-containing protein [Miltoncostaea marina]|uniref:nucleotidyltransferase domain-containing protein n=1 Tax=Miltoncostaea marina TaxID=2843215 RepID=UPI001C3C526E|nr:nucleotidyltransferase [Miltoncostaea marina]